MESIGKHQINQINARTKGRKLSKYRSRALVNILSVSVIRNAKKGGLVETRQTQGPDPDPGPGPVPAV